MVNFSTCVKRLPQRGRACLLLTLFLVALVVYLTPWALEHLSFRDHYGHFLGSKPYEWYDKDAYTRRLWGAAVYNLSTCKYPGHFPISFSASSPALRPSSSFSSASSLSAASQHSQHQNSKAHSHARRSLKEARNAAVPKDQQQQQHQQVVVRKKIHLFRNRSHTPLQLEWLWNAILPSSPGTFEHSPTQMTLADHGMDLVRVKSMDDLAAAAHRGEITNLFLISAWDKMDELRREFAAHKMPVVPTGAIMMNSEHCNTSLAHILTDVPASQRQPKLGEVSSDCNRV